DHCERQPRSRERLSTVVPAQLLHPLLEGFGHEILHLRCRSAGPGGDDRHLLDGERRIFRASELEEGDDAGDGDGQEQKQRDGALAYGERGQIERAHFGAPSLVVRRAAGVCASRICSPSRSRCAPSATTRSPVLRLPRTDAAPSLRLAICTGRHVTRGESPGTNQTPAPLPESKIAPMGTCTDCTNPTSAMRTETVEPSGALARPPSST